MKTQFIEAFGAIQELFTELSMEGKVTIEQAERFNQAQKTVVNFSSWVDNKLHPVQKVDLPWQDEKFTEAWQLWKDFKKQQFSFTYKLIGEQGALKDLADLSGGKMELAIAIIHQSIKKGWKGFFQIRNELGKTSTTVVPNLDHKEDILRRLNVNS